MEHIEIKALGNISVVKISSPPDGYMTDHVVSELTSTVRTLEKDDASVVVLTGGLPGIFVQHYDLVELHDIGSRMKAKGITYSETGHVPERRIDLLFRAIESSSKIYIAAINGNAMGGGLEMALACDFRILEQGDYQIGLPEVHVGQLPGAGGTQRLTRLLGLASALDLMLHGRRLSPDDALAVGLCHEVADDALAAALIRAEALAKSNPRSLAHIKRLVYSTYANWIYDGLDLERRLFLDLLSSEEGLNRLSSVCHSGRDFLTL